jgi:hypothetical protein
MREPHVIRLRGPWKFTPLSRTVGDLPLPAVGKVTMPCDWGDSLGRDFRGRVCYVRRFGRPEFMPAYEQLWLVFNGIRSAATVSLNGERLGEVRGDDPGNFELTGKLAARNVLEVIVEQPAEATEPGGITGIVQLEIE